MYHPFSVSRALVFFFFQPQESKNASEIVAVSVGPKAAADTIRTALAMGADRGVHVLTDDSIRTDQQLEPLTVAKILKKASVAVQRPAMRPLFVMESSQNPQGGRAWRRSVHRRCRRDVGLRVGCFGDLVFSGRL